MHTCAHTHTHTHTHTHHTCLVGLLSVSDQAITETATYMTQQQTEEMNISPSAVFEPAIKQPQSYMP